MIRSIGTGIGGMLWVFATVWGVAFLLIFGTNELGVSYDSIQRTQGHSHTLTWDHVTEAVGYEIYWKLDPKREWGFHDAIPCDAVCGVGVCTCDVELPEPLDRLIVHFTVVAIDDKGVRGEW